jgi:hypothetical protein
VSNKTVRDNFQWSSRRKVKYHGEDEQNAMLVSQENALMTSAFLNCEQPWSSFRPSNQMILEWTGLNSITSTRSSEIAQLGISG